MELSTEDKQRIEKEVERILFRSNLYPHDALFKMAEYATIYEREQFEQERKDAYNAGLMCERILTKDEIERLKAERSELKNAIKKYFELRESPKVYTREGATEFMDVQKIIHDAIKPCRACEIESNDEQVKQMPEHSCSKGPTREPIKMKASQFEEHEHFVSELSKIQQENAELRNKVIEECITALHNIGFDATKSEHSRRMYERLNSIKTK